VAYTRPRSGIPSTFPTYIGETVALYTVIEAQRVVLQTNAEYEDWMTSHKLIVQGPVITQECNICTEIMRTDLSQEVCTKDYAIWKPATASYYT